MTDNLLYTPTYTPASIPCLVCGDPLLVRPARGRKSGKPFLMLMCGRDARHFRAFVNDQKYVRAVLARLETQTRANAGGDDPEDVPDPVASSGADLELGNGDVQG